MLKFLGRHKRKAVALFFIALGILYGTPPMIPILLWTEALMNVPTAHLIMKFTFIKSMFWSLIITFTLLPAILIYLGACIYPYNTQGILRGTYHRIQNAIMKYISLVKKNPMYLFGLVLSLAIIYYICRVYSISIESIL